MTTIYITKYPAFYLNLNNNSPLFLILSTKFGK